MSSYVLFDARSPYKTQSLESFFLISLPNVEWNEIVNSQVAIAFSQFDWRLSQMFEVQSWANHTSEYEIIQTDQLPDVVYENIRLMIEENDPDI